MSTIEKCKLISERMMLITKNEYIYENLPKGLRICYSLSYEEVDTKSEIVDKFSDFVIDTIDLETRNIYLYLVGSYGWGQSTRVTSYYKLWKYIKKMYLIDDFSLGSENEIYFRNKLQYCGIAKVEAKYISDAINIMIDKEQSCFILITDRDIDIFSKEVKKYFQTIINDNFKGYNEINYIEIYEHLKKNENIINIVSDSEEIALHISNREF